MSVVRASTWSITFRDQKSGQAMSMACHEGQLAFHQDVDLALAQVIAEDKARAAFEAKGPGEPRACIRIKPKGEADHG